MPHQRGVDLIGGEIGFAFGAFRLLAHARPDVGVNGHGVSHRLGRIVGDSQVEFGHFAPKTGQLVSRELIPFRRGHDELHAQSAAAFGQAAGHVVAVADVGQRLPFNRPTSSLSVYRSASAWQGWRSRSGR